MKNLMPLALLMPPQFVSCSQGHGEGHGVAAEQPGERAASAGA